MIEHNCTSIYWLILLVGVITLFYRFCEKTARDRLQGTKDGIADLMEHAGRLFGDEERRGLVNQVNSKLREILIPVEKGVVACAVTSLIIFVTQICFFIFDIPNLGTWTKSALGFFAIIILMLSVDSYRVFKKLKREAEKLHEGYLNKRLEVKARITGS